MEDIQLAPAYDQSNCTTGIDPDDDWAIINLATAMPATTTDMDLSQQTTLGTREIKSNGYPSFIPGTGSCTANNAPAVNSGIGAAVLYHQNDVDITEYTGQKAKATMDAMNRQSGGPVWYCIGGNDTCEVGEQGGVAMVLASWDPGVIDRFSGPRVVAHRADMLAVIH